MKRTLFMLALGLAVAGSAWAAKPLKFEAHLEGFAANNPPPGQLPEPGGVPVDTNATGVAKVEVIDDMTAVRFRVNVAGIENLWMAHIHIARNPVEVTDPAGPPAFWFVGGPRPAATLSETVNGRLAEGYIITDDDLVSWDTEDPLNKTVEGLINAIVEGRASVIVHTNDLNADTTDPVQGDSPAGELRGTLR